MGPMKLLGWLLVGAVAQFYWPAWTIGVLVILLIGSICWWVYEQATIHTLRDPLYPECNGSCNTLQGRGKCNCPHRRPT